MLNDERTSAPVIPAAHPPAKLSQAATAYHTDVQQACQCHIKGEFSSTTLALSVIATPLQPDFYAGNNSMNSAKRCHCTADTQLKPL